MQSVLYTCDNHENRYRQFRFNWFSLSHSFIMLSQLAFFSRTFYFFIFCNRVSNLDSIFLSLAKEENIVLCVFAHVVFYTKKWLLQAKKKTAFFWKINTFFENAVTFEAQVKMEQSHRFSSSKNDEESEKDHYLSSKFQYNTKISNQNQGVLL